MPKELYFRQKVMETNCGRRDRNICATLDASSILRNIKRMWRGCNFWVHVTWLTSTRLAVPVPSAKEPWILYCITRKKMKQKNCWNCDARRTPTVVHVPIQFDFIPSYWPQCLWYHQYFNSTTVPYQYQRKKGQSRASTSSCWSTAQWQEEFVRSSAGVAGNPCPVVSEEAEHNLFVSAIIAKDGKAEDQVRGVEKTFSEGHKLLVHWRKVT